MLYRSLAAAVCVSAGSGYTRVMGPATTVHVACFPGSFDPPTFGHLDVVERGRKLFDRIVVGVGQNPDKDTLFAPDERLEMVRQLVADLVKRQPIGASVDVMGYTGLTVDFARSQGALVLLRGIRNLSDLQYEIQQALTNREVAGLETAFVVAGQTLAYTSSTLIRQITALGDDLSVLAPMVPAPVIERLKAKRAQNPVSLRRIAEGAL